MPLPERRPARPTAMAGALAAALLAAPAGAETLEDALARAYAEHPRIQAAQAAVRVAEARVREERGGWYPYVSGRAAVSQNRREQTSGSDGAGRTVTTPTSHEAGVTVRQRVYDFGSTGGAVGRARAELQAARYRALETEQDVLYNAALAYLDLLRAGERVAIAVRGEENIESDLQATRDRFEVGEVTRTDVAQAEARLADRRAARLASENRREVALAAYRDAVGGDPGGAPAFPSAPPRLPAAFEEARAAALESHPLLQAARSDVEAAREALRAGQGRILPAVDLVGQGSYARSPNSFFREARDYALGLEATIPLYGGGSEWAALRRLRETAARAQRDLDALVRTRTREAASAWQNYASAQEEVVAFEASVRANEIASEGVRREAEVGTRTTLDVLDADQELLVARDNLAQARRDLHVAAYALLRAVGRMTARDWGLAADG